MRVRDDRSRDGTGKCERYGIVLPEIVRRAVVLAEESGFPVMPEGRPVDSTAPPSACIPQVGRLLAALAASRPGGRLGEQGTGAGIGTAWMVSGMSAESHLLSVEIDSDLARATAEQFRDHPNVEIREGDCMEVMADEAPPERWPADWDDLVDRKREFAFHNPRVLGAEVRTTPTEVALVVTRVR